MVIHWSTFTSVDFCLVKYTVFWQKFQQVGELLLSSHFAIDEGAIFKNEIFITNDSKNISLYNES